MRVKIPVTVLVTDEAVSAEVDANDLPIVGRYAAVGAAKKHPKDKPNDEIGTALAYARAFQMLADTYADHAVRLIEGA